MKKKIFLSLSILLGFFFVVSTSFAIPVVNERPYTGLPYDSAWANDYPSNLTYWQNNEQSLQTILDTYTNTGFNAITDQSNVGAWEPAEAAVDSYLVTMIKGDAGKFGIYSLLTGNEYYLASDSDVRASFSIYNGSQLEINNSGSIADSNFGPAFGFFWENTSNPMKSYTQDGKNATNTGYGNMNALALSYLIPDSNEGDQVKIKTIVGHDWVASEGENDWILAFEDRPYGDAWGDGDFNDAVFYIEDIKSVPEPAYMLLLGTCLVGLAGLGRKKLMKK